MRAKACDFRTLCMIGSKQIARRQSERKYRPAISNQGRPRLSARITPAGIPPPKGMMNSKKTSRKSFRLVPSARTSQRIF